MNHSDLNLHGISPIYDQTVLVKCHLCKFIVKLPQLVEHLERRHHVSSEPNAANTNFFEQLPQQTHLTSSSSSSSSIVNNKKAIISNRGSRKAGSNTKTTTRLVKTQSVNELNLNTSEQTLLHQQQQTNVKKLNKKINLKLENNQHVKLNAVNDAKTSISVDTKCSNESDVLAAQKKFSYVAEKIKTKINGSSAANIRKSDTEKQCNISQQTDEFRLTNGNCGSSIANLFSYKENNEQTSNYNQVNNKRMMDPAFLLASNVVNENVSNNKQESEFNQSEEFIQDDQFNNKNLSLLKSNIKTSKTYDPNKHCGVVVEQVDSLTGERTFYEPCTRSLTCKKHSINLRRQVIGRCKSFNELFKEYRNEKFSSNNSNGSVYGLFNSINETGDEEINQIETMPASLNYTPGIIPINHHQQNISSSKKLSSSLTMPSLSYDLFDQQQQQLSNYNFSNNNSIQSGNYQSNYQNNNYEQKNFFVQNKVDFQKIPYLNDSNFYSSLSNRNNVNGNGGNACGFENSEHTASANLNLNHQSTMLVKHHPRPSAVTSFNARLTDNGGGYTLWNRKQDHLRLVLTNAFNETTGFLEKNRSYTSNSINFDATLNNSSELTGKNNSPSKSARKRNISNSEQLAKQTDEYFLSPPLPLPLPLPHSNDKLFIEKTENLIKKSKIGLTNKSKQISLDELTSSILEEEEDNDVDNINHGESNKKETNLSKFMESSETFHQDYNNRDLFLKQNGHHERSFNELAKYFKYPIMPTLNGNVNNNLKTLNEFLLSNNNGQHTDHDDEDHEIIDEENITTSNTAATNHSIYQLNTNSVSLLPSASASSTASSSTSNLINGSLLLNSIN